MNCHKLITLYLHDDEREFIFWYFHDDYLIIMINTNNKGLISRIISCLSYFSCLFGCFSLRPRWIKEFFCSSLCAGSNRIISSLSQEYHPKFICRKRKHSLVLLIELHFKSSTNCLYDIVTVVRFFTAFSFDIIFVINFPVHHTF